MITLSSSIKILAVGSFISSHITRVRTDGQTDGQNYDPQLKRVSDDLQPLCADSEITSTVIPDEYTILPQTVLAKLEPVSYTHLTLPTNREV